MPCPAGSEQQAQRAFLPLCFLQSTEGNLGRRSEDVLHILPKLGRTFQVEGRSDLFTGTLALGGGERPALDEEPGAWGTS